MEIPQQIGDGFRCVLIGTKLAIFDIPEWGYYEVIEYTNIGNVFLAPAEPELVAGLEMLEAFYGKLEKSKLLDKAKVKTVVPFKDHFYALKTDIHNKWVRAKVVSLDFGNQLACVMLIDISHSVLHQVPFSRLFNLESRFWDLPQRIIKFKLANVQLTHADDSRELLKELGLMKAGDIVCGHVPRGQQAQNEKDNKRLAIHLIQPKKPNQDAVDIQKVLVLYKSAEAGKNVHTWGSPPNALRKFLDLKQLTGEKSDVKSPPEPKKFIY